ncbi:unnamed protein product, partial [Closterium sp. NIES-54]
MCASQLLYLLRTPHAMCAVVDSSAFDSVYSRVFSLGASVDPVPVASVGTRLGTSPGTAQEDALLSFTLDSRASHCFFRDHTTLTPLPAPVSVALARYTTTLLCPAVPSGFLTGFHVPLFSSNLVGVRPLVGSHVGVWFEPSGDSVTCVDGDTYAPLATFQAEPGSVPPSHQVPASHQVAVSGQVPESGHVVASCSCQSLAHPTVLWHRRLGHPSIPRLHTMSSQRLVLGLPRVLPSLPPSPAPPYAPCVEGRLRANPHSSSLRPATEPFETLHLDVWGPASRPGPERESFFLVVIDDYSRYTIVFPLTKKSEVTCTLIRWLLTTADTRGHRVSCLHSDRGEDSSDFTFYHPPLHRFLDSRDVSFDESVPYYTRYPCRGLPVPPPPLPDSHSPYCSSGTATPLGPAPSGVSHATPTLSVAPQVPPLSPQSSSQPTTDPAGAGVSIEDPRGASSRGVGVGAVRVYL